MIYKQANGRYLAFALKISMIFIAAAIPSAAESSEANVPFPFYFGDKLYQAGQYTINDGAVASAVVSIRSADRRVQGMLLSTPENRAEHSVNPPALMFVRYPDGHNYLRTVRTSSLTSSLAKSPVEQQSAMTLEAGAKPTQIAVLANAR